ncbi:MAG TPA: OmpA family protein [Bryobacteraceae bacterium]|nr:OmpA family protein [Bryobacteraceae bacterium]
MKNDSFRFEKPILALTVGTALLFASCGGKKTAIAPPPPPPPGANTNTGGATVPGRPVISEFSIEPTTVERGQSAVMRWTVTGSNNVAISNGIGTVPASGTRRMTPDVTATYTLTASGTGGETTATATVTVTSPAPPPPPARNTNTGNIGTLEKRVESDLRDVLYDYDSNNVSDAARTALLADADALKRIFADFPNATVNVEGHCDERGSAEYNLGLGDRRASSARDFLIQQGIPADKLKTISYGKERPVCTESDESCWQRNRRAHFSVGQ